METFVVGTLSAAATAAGFYLLIDAVKVRGYNKANPFALFLVATIEEDATEEIAMGKKLVETLAAGNYLFTLEAVVPHVGDRVHFYVAVPRNVSVSVEKKLQRIFGRFAVELVHDDHIVFYPHGVSVAASLVQKEPAAIPLPLYEEVGADIFKDVLAALRDISAIGEGAATQFVVKPMDSRKFRAAAEPKNLPHCAHVKLNGPLFEVNARVVVSAGSEFRARDILGSILTAYERFRGQGRNALKRVTPRSPRLFVLEFLDRKFDARQSLVLSTAELANLFHVADLRERL